MSSVKLDSITNCPAFLYNISINLLFKIDESLPRGSNKNWNLENIIKV